MGSENKLIQMIFGATSTVKLFSLALLHCTKTHFGIFSCSELNKKSRPLKDALVKRPGADPLLAPGLESARCPITTRGSSVSEALFENVEESCVSVQRGRTSQRKKQRESEQKSGCCDDDHSPNRPWSFSSVQLGHE